MTESVSDICGTGTQISLVLAGGLAVHLVPQPMSSARSDGLRGACEAGHCAYPEGTMLRLLAGNVLALRAGIPAGTGCGRARVSHGDVSVQRVH